MARKHKNAKASRMDRRQDITIGENTYTVWEYTEDRLAELDAKQVRDLTMNDLYNIIGTKLTDRELRAILTAYGYRVS